MSDNTVFGRKKPEKRQQPAVSQQECTCEEPKFANGAHICEKCGGSVEDYPLSVEDVFTIEV